MLSGRPGPFFKWNASLWAEGIIISPERIRVPVLLLVQCWSLHIFSRAEFSLSPAVPHDLKASAFLQICKEEKEYRNFNSSSLKHTTHPCFCSHWLTSKLQALKGKVDPTLIRRCEAVRRGAGRSTPAGLHAPNTKADLAPAKPSWSSSRPETQEREFQRRKKLWWGLRIP